MKVLFVIHTPKDPHTAVYTGYVRLATFMETQGHEATIIAPQDFPGLARAHARWFPVLYPFRVAWWLLGQGQGFDLVVFHSYAGWVVNVVRRLIPGFRRMRTVTSFHGLEPLYYDALREEMEKVGRPLRFRYRLVHGSLMDRLLALSCSRSDRVLCLNRQEADYLVKNSWQRASKVVVVPKGVPREFFLSRTYAPVARHLLFVGQWREMKGVHYLAEAFSLLARERPELKLWCVGTLLGEESVLATFPSDVRSQVVVRPRVGREELIEIYREADIFLFPTLSEGFGNVLFEAMATALPVITTPVGAARDYLESDVNGLLVPARDVGALAGSVLRLIDDVALRARLGRQAQATASRVEMACVHQRMVSLFEDILVAGAFPRPTRKEIEDYSTL
jgi:glycosyltransferase involved in cell wall biosynthesis